VVSVCVGKGSEQNVADFATFCPKALAGIGRLPDTIASRCVPIVMRRKAPHESAERMRMRDARARSEPLRARLAAAAERLLEEGLGDARPIIPENLPDRAADCWEPLLAIADAADAAWALRARTAAEKLSGGGLQEEGESLGVRLLRDLHRVFTAQHTDRLPTKAILDQLCVMDEAPWGDVRGAALDARRLATLLRPYAVRPTTFRGDTGTFKGYRMADLVDPWERYCALAAAHHLAGPEHPEQPERVAQADVPDVPDVPLVPEAMVGAEPRADDEPDPFSGPWDWNAR